MPGDKNFIGSVGPQKKSKKLEEDKYLFSKTPPFNSILNEIKQGYEEGSELEVWLTSLGPELETDLKSALQQISDQQSDFFTEDKSNRKKMNFDISPLLELKNKYPDNKEVMDFINLKVLPILERNAEEEFDQDPNFVDQKKEFNSKLFEKENKGSLIKSETYLNDFFENKDGGGDKRNWVWAYSKDGAWVDMRVKLSTVGDRYAGIEIDYLPDFTDEGETGGDNLLKFLKGKKIIGVKANGDSLYLYILKDELIPPLRSLP